ncbi:MAG: hypothetical protein QOF49_2320 [Chloroflexota bacterium]|nr:hypothetical protein [Chloroflexota bacterium]
MFDACLALEPAQLDTTVPGTYGSIIDTLRHLVAGDCGYLFALTGGRTAEIDEERMELAALRERMEANGAEWAAVVAEDIDPDADIVRHREDGIDSHAPFGIRLAQALHHGTDHRSQICTALSSLGVTPPEIDVWEFADQDGKLSETTAAS